MGWHRPLARSGSFARFPKRSCISKEEFFNGSFVRVTIDRIVGGTDEATLRNYAQEMLDGTLSYFGYVNGTAAFATIEAEVSRGARTFHYGIDSLAFPPDVRSNVNEDYAFAVGSRRKGVLALTRALMDYRAAIASPHDTAFYCYRAIEGMMNSFPSALDSFDAPSRGDSPTPRWEPFNERLGIEGFGKSWLNRAGQQQRHGGGYYLSGEMREIGLSFTREIVWRWMKFLRGTLSQNPPLIRLTAA
jgi:hypothetical protein